jgi:hypothetical protein
VAKKAAENLFNIREIEACYRRLQRQHLARDGVESPRFIKWFHRARMAAEYYARGGMEYLRDRNLPTLDLSSLPRAWKRTPIRGFDTLAKDAHALNWVVFQGKHFVPGR